MNRRWPMVDDTVMLCDPDIADAIRCEAGAADELNSRLVGRAVGRPALRRIDLLFLAPIVSERGLRRISLRAGMRARSFSN